MKRRSRRPATQPRKVEFEIDHIDPLGQGVSKQGETITFVAGTLPGESGTATVYKRAKGVQFARLDSLHKTAEQPHRAGLPTF